MSGKLSREDNRDLPKMVRSVHYMHVMFLTRSSGANIIYKYPLDNGDFNALRLAERPPARPLRRVRFMALMKAYTLIHVIIVYIKYYA